MAHKSNLSLKLTGVDADADAADHATPAAALPADSALAAAHHSIILAIDGSSTGIWDRNVVTGEIRYSAGWKRILGYGDDEVGARIEESYTRLHPDDLPYVRQAMQDHFDGKTAVYAVEHRIRCKNGDYIWIASRGKVVARDAGGRALRMTGTSTDITAVKLLTQQLQHSVELVTSLSDQVPGLLFQYRLEADGTARFPYASAGLGEMFELAPGQVAGDAAALEALVHSGDLAPYRASLLASAASLAQWHLEFRVMLPRQGLRWRQAAAQPRRLDDGATVWHGLITDITERKHAEARMEANAMLDFLTGLANRRKFMQCLSEESARLLRHRGAAAALLMFDMDHFKAINDQHGHACGDAVLTHFASILKSELRAVDTAGRMGGEEFAVLLCGTSLDLACQVAQRIQRHLASRPCLVAGRSIAVTVSIGIGALSADCAGIEAALEGADAAMYRAKQAGRNRIVTA